MNIITGYTGTPHVTAQQDRDINLGVVGPDVYILPVGDQLETAIGNLDVIIYCGAVSIQGCMACIDYGSSETISVNSAGTGYHRNDLLCAYYVNGTAGVESITLRIVEGSVYDTAISTDYDPTGYDVGNIKEGDSGIYFPLWRVIVDEYAIDSITPLVPTLTDLYTTNTALTALTSVVDGKTPKFVFASQDDWYDKMATISTYVPFMFRGEATFTNELFDVGSGSYSSWGIGMKFGSGGYHFLFICNHNLYYHVTTSSSATTYHPLNLKTNI